MCVLTIIRVLISLFLIIGCVLGLFGCSIIRLWEDPSAYSSDPNRVWINEEYNIWFVVDDDNLDYYGQIAVDGELLKFDVGTRRGNMEFYILKRPDDKYCSIINCGARYVMGKIILSVSSSDFPQIPKGTKLVFKPYPRQAEHYLPK